MRPVIILVTVCISSTHLISGFRGSSLPAGSATLSIASSPRVGGSPVHALGVGEIILAPAPSALHRKAATTVLPTRSARPGADLSILSEGATHVPRVVRSRNQLDTERKVGRECKICQGKIP